MIKLNNQTSVKSEMLILKPVYEVYEAFVNPDITTKFWFTKSNGRLEVGKHVRWDWEIYGVWDEIHVKELETNKRIVVESSDGSTIEWIFNDRSENETFVTISVSGFMLNLVADHAPDAHVMGWNK